MPLLKKILNISKGVKRCKMMVTNGKLIDLLALIFICSIVIYSMKRAEKSKNRVEIRKIPALDAIEEAIERSVEVGRPVLYCGGKMPFSGTDGPASVAAYSILNYVARVAAQKGADLLHICGDAEQIPLAVEMLKSGFTLGGAPEKYNDSIIRFFPGWSFTIGFLALLKKEKPASTIYFGPWYHESIIIGETGVEIGAFQIGGSSLTAQTPFFVCTMDYITIGEEIFAGAGYCTQNQPLLGAMRGQDIVKILALILITISFLTVSFNMDFFTKLLGV